MLRGEDVKLALRELDPENIYIKHNASAWEERSIATQAPVMYGVLTVMMNLSLTVKEFTDALMGNAGALFG